MRESRAYEAVKADVVSSTNHIGAEGDYAQPYQIHLESCAKKTGLGIRRVDDALATAFIPTTFSLSSILTTLIAFVLSSLPLLYKHQHSLN